MIISVKVISNACFNEIIKENDVFKVHLKAKAVKNEANKALIKLLSEYFKVKKTQIIILKGEKSKNKLVKII